jgi:hypothetical protein
MVFDPRQDSFQHLGNLLAEAPQMVVFVTGSGLSVPAGLPTWPKLASNLKIEAINYLKNSSGLDDQETAERIFTLNGFKDLWLLGDAIEASLPQELYRKVVRRELSTLQAPPTYEAIWSLNPSGVVSLNLDSIAERTLGGTSEQLATGAEPGKFQRFLLFSGRKFLMQPHGRLDDPSSWVLGARARNGLLRNKDYRRFISAVLSSRRLVLVGLQPNDFALESLFLEDIRGELSDGLEHFWITTKLDADAEAWARLYKVKPVVYSTDHEHHPEVLQVLQELSRFEPREPLAPLAYEGEIIDPKTLPADEELRKQPVEDIRRRLNAALGGLISQEGHGDDPGKVVASFYRNFSGSVHMAWHITSESPYGWVWGRRVEKSLGEGGFGKVWKVRDPVDGTTLALKVLHEDVVDQEGFVNAFRRGVSAMKILKDRSVGGVVRLEAAYDLPSCLFMEFIDGGTLEQAVLSRTIDSLKAGLEVIDRVAAIAEPRTYS